MDRIDRLLTGMVEAQNSVSSLAGQGEFREAAEAIGERDRLWRQIADDFRALVEALEEAPCWPIDGSVGQFLQDYHGWHKGPRQVTLARVKGANDG